jgi:hypothetical protein
MLRRTAVRAASAALFLFFAIGSSAFAQNQPPAAQPQTVFTQGLEPLTILLRGSDPEGRDLRFAIVEPPRYGSLSDPKEIVPEPETDPRTGEPVQPPVTSASVVYRPEKELPDSFTFAVIDAEGASGVAVVLINPPSNEPPPPPVTTVIAHDTVADVFRDKQTVLTLTGAAPEKTSLTFALRTHPEKGEIGELVQGTEQPRRTATVSYTPARGYTGDDAFELEACGDVEGQYICDTATYRINVIERPQEPVLLVSDIHAKTPMNREVRISLDTEQRPNIGGKSITLRATVAGNVADADGDGRGDNRNELPGPRPLFMSAGLDRQGDPGINGTARMHLEFDLRDLKGVEDITGATVVVRTHRESKDGLLTRFLAAGKGDGELTESDFESDAEDIPGAVLPMPSLEQMPVGAEGTFTFDVLGELRAALADGLPLLALQGRVDEKSHQGPIAGLDVRTTAEDNLREALEPAMVIETAHAPDPLEYTILSLPEAGTLLDAAGNPIREVPYRLTNSATVTYAPPKDFIGQTGFRFQASDGVLTQTANAVITVFLGRCAEDADFCNNGR